MAGEDQRLVCFAVLFGGCDEVKGKRLMSDKTLRLVALFATLLVPLGLLHAFVLTEVCIAITDLAFLYRCARTKDWGWLRYGWVQIALVWWVWLVFCSIPIPLLGLGSAGWKMGFLQAVVVIRLIIYTAALQNWVLTTQKSRQVMVWMLVLSAAWIGLEAWQQYFTGHNIFGDQRWPDGALTGPFRKPRAGQLYAHILYPAILPAVAILLTSKRRLAYICGLLLAVLGLVTSVLIGQRMGLALNGMGALVAAFFLPRLRLPVAIGAVVAVVFLLLTPIISPPTYHKLVGETHTNMGHFWLSPYGQLYIRATQMGLQSPLHGWGYNGFREHCPEPRFEAGIPALSLPKTDINLGACNLHPQNYYVQAFVDAGVPGFVLFTLLCLWWFKDMLAGLWRDRDPLRIALFIAALTFLWPLASTDEFPTLYMLGWFFFMLGIGYAAKPQLLDAGQKSA